MDKDDQVIMVKAHEPALGRETKEWVSMGIGWT